VYDRHGDFTAQQSSMTTAPDSDPEYLRKVFQLLYRCGDRWVYSFRGHADFKHRHRGDLQKAYFGRFTRWRNIQTLIGLMRVCQIFRS
jgi:hypothetical protein